MAKVAFLGLGVMGFPMAGHLIAKGGHEVIVYNRTETKADRWIEIYGGQKASTPAEAATDADFVFSCVGNDDDLRAVAIGSHGAFQSMQPNTVFIDHTTASATVARELNAIANEKGLGFLDAPVSGGQAGAENGVLTVMAGGDHTVFERAKPIISCFARKIGLMGPTGAGQLTKMVNQICITGLVQGLAEGIHFAQQAGLNIDHVIDVISKGAAGSWQMENRSKTMNENHYEHGFAVDWMRKDLDIALQEARRNGTRLPVTALVDQFYADIQAMGGQRWDTSSLLVRLQKFHKN